MIVTKTIILLNTFNVLSISSNIPKRVSKYTQKEEMFFIHNLGSFLFIYLSIWVLKKTISLISMVTKEKFRFKCIVLIDLLFCFHKIRVILFLELVFTSNFLTFLKFWFLYPLHTPKLIYVLFSVSVMNLYLKMVY